LSRPEEASIVGEQIVIRLPIRNLRMAVRGASEICIWDSPLRVTNPRAFARDVCAALNAEDEAGTTAIHRLFDAAFMRAADDGSEGVEGGRYEEDGTAVFAKPVRP
jgi:hypothetical protein